MRDGIFLGCDALYNSMTLKSKLLEPYKVKNGQTVRSLANECATTAYAIVARNGLTEELYEGQLIFLPDSANLYTVQAGDTKKDLCGSEERYRKMNGTDVFYPAMRVLIGEK